MKNETKDTRKAATHTPTAKEIDAQFYSFLQRGKIPSYIDTDKSYGIDLGKYYIYLCNGTEYTTDRGQVIQWRPSKSEATGAKWIDKAGAVVGDVKRRFQWEAIVNDWNERRRRPSEREIDKVRTIEGAKVVKAIQRAKDQGAAAVRLGAAIVSVDIAAVLLRWLNVHPAAALEYAPATSRNCSDKDKNSTILATEEATGAGFLAMALRQPLTDTMDIYDVTETTTTTRTTMKEFNIINWNGTETTTTAANLVLTEHPDHDPARGQWIRQRVRYADEPQTIEARGGRFDYVQDVAAAIVSAILEEIDYNAAAMVADLKDKFCGIYTPGKVTEEAMINFIDSIKYSDYTTGGESMVFNPVGAERRLAFNMETALTGAALFGPAYKEYRAATSSPEALEVCARLAVYEEAADRLKAAGILSELLQLLNHVANQ